MRADATSPTDLRPFWVAGRTAVGHDVLTVHNPDGSQVGQISVPTAGHIDAACAAAADAQAKAAALSLGERAAACSHVAQRLLERQEEFAQLITAENGKPIRWARIEVARAASVFRWAAEEARRWSGDVQRLDTEPSTTGRLALVRRVPKGPVLAIAPFNFPLNLVAHKVAPAIAVGAPVVIKPAPSTPLSALLLGELLAETDLPAGMWSVLPVTNEAMPGLVQDPRLPIISFTGSAPVGFAIQRSVPGKHVVLELGGNATAVVLGDYCTDADLDFAATRISEFAHYQAGQSCISVQRVLVDRSVYEPMVERITAATRRLAIGDPNDPATDVGPLVDEQAARRVESWIEEAVELGAKVLTGGEREGATLSPAVLTNVPEQAKLSQEEAFGPVVTVAPIDGVD
ncbi:MAG: aldehyde dehydrogenase family protein, partial [Candidatus Nanopelagicales bacterium]